MIMAVNVVFVIVFVTRDAARLSLCARLLGWFLPFCNFPV